MADGRQDEPGLPEVRPPASPELGGAELLRWYWLKSELVALARHLGVSTAGGKQELTHRLVAALDGVVPLDSARGTKPALRAGPQLTGELTPDTVIPVGQRSSQLLRRFFELEIGPEFRFDAAMRDRLTRGGGTLGDAVAFWHASRAGSSRDAGPPSEIPPQFELNRFIRAWHAAHPDGSRAAALTAWREHRSKPVEARDRR